MEKHSKIDEARKILELNERATIPEIKEAYRKLSLRYHPDKCKDNDKAECEEKFKQINNANGVLIEYCLNYKFPFKQAEEERTLKDKGINEHMQRFYDGWWGDLKK